MGKTKRIPVDVLDVPRIGRLGDTLWRYYIELWLIADEDGTLPHGRAIAWRLRRDAGACADVMITLSQMGLLEFTDDHYIHCMAQAQNEQRIARANSGYGPDWPKTREYILERDSHTCRYCGEPALQVDHIIPRCQGGTEEHSNLVAACGPCNMSKGGRTPVQAGMELRGD